MASAEDDPGDTIRPRLDTAGADVSSVHVLGGCASRSPITPQQSALSISRRESARLRTRLRASVVSPSRH